VNGLNGSLQIESEVDQGGIDDLLDKKDSHPALPSAIDEVSAVMEMNPLPPLPSPRDENFLHDFPLLPSSPVDSTRATLDSSSTVTDVSLDLMPGDLRCFEDEGGADGMGGSSNHGGLYTPPETDMLSLFELSSSSESSGFVPIMFDHRPPTLSGKALADSSFSPPHPHQHHPSHHHHDNGHHLTKDLLTISIPQPTNDMLRVRRSSPSNSPRRRDDGCSPYYYVPEATCLIARSLVSKVRQWRESTVMGILVLMSQ